MAESLVPPATLVPTDWVAFDRLDGEGKVARQIDEIEEQAADEELGLPVRYKVTFVDDDPTRFILFPVTMPVTKVEPD